MTALQYHASGLHRLTCKGNQLCPCSESLHLQPTDKQLIAAIAAVDSLPIAMTGQMFRAM